MTEIHQAKVLITGGGNGLGRLLALECADRGAQLVLWDLDADGLRTTAEAARARGATDVMTKVVDVSDRKKVYAAAREVGDVDVLVNNAGIVSGKPLLDTPDEKIISTMAVNTMALFWTTKAFLPAMVQRNSGHLVTIASAAGLVGVRGLADYCASKFAAVGFDEAMRMELRHSAPGVKTTVMCPFYIDTGMFHGVKTRVPWLLPILEPEDAAKRMIRAIEKNRAQLPLPPFTRTLPVFRALPVKVFDWAADVLGVNASMDDFRGRQGDSQAESQPAART